MEPLPLWGNLCVKGSGSSSDARLSPSDGDASDASCELQSWGIHPPEGDGCMQSSQSMSDEWLRKAVQEAGSTFENF